MSDNKAVLSKVEGNYITPKGRMLWNALFEKRKPKGSDGEPKFELSVMFPKDADNSLLWNKAIEAGKARFPKEFAAAVKDGKQRWPEGIRNPFKKVSGDDKLADYTDGYEIYIAARDKNRPGIVGPNGQKIDDPEQVYSGRWCKMSVQVFAYPKEGNLNRGVSFGLANVQLLDNDEPISVGGGKPAAEAEFEAADFAGDDTKSASSAFD